MIDLIESGLISGRYNIQTLLGEGTFGKVYLAKQEVFELSFRSVALKLFEKEIESTKQARHIFTDTILLINLLENCHDPQIKEKFIQVYDIGLTSIKVKGEGIRKKGYITMERMDNDLRKVIGQTGKPNFRKTTVKEALFYMKPVIDALAYMHTQKEPILHRDLKPENILLRMGKEKGRDVTQVKVADFGLAVQMFNIWELPQAAGTVPYQDLESFKWKTASPESDVYGIGVIFYELLTGQYPFNIAFVDSIPTDSLSQEILSDRLSMLMSKPIQPPSDFNFELKNYPWLEELILQCLKPRRVDRISNAAEVKQLLEEAGNPTSSPSRISISEQYKAFLEAGKTAFARDRKNWSEAESNFLNAIKLLDGPCDAIIALAHQLVERGEWIEAEKLLHERLNQNRDCPHVYLELAYLFGKKQNQLMREFYLDKAEKMGECKYSFFISHETITPEMPSGRADLVQFSVFSPRSVRPGNIFEIEIYAHLDLHRNEVKKRAAESFGEEEIKMITEGPIKIPRGNVLTVQLDIKGFTVDNSPKTIYWAGVIGTTRFLVSVPNNTKSGNYVGEAVIKIDGWQKVIKLKFTLYVGNKNSTLEPLSLQEERYRTAFASYASKDRDEVLSVIQGILKGMPGLDIFLDVKSLRSGDKFKEKLFQTIITRDIFYLFWSKAASKSKWVDWEWRCAFENRGIEFIDPVPLIPPDVVPPPSELSRELHFNDWVLAFKSTRRMVNN